MLRTCSLGKVWNDVFIIKFILICDYCCGLAIVVGVHANGEVLSTQIEALNGWNDCVYHVFDLIPQ